MKDKAAIRLSDKPDNFELIDYTTFSEEAQLFGEEIIKDMVDEFLGTFDEKKAQLRCLLENRDFIQLRFEAHRMAGTVGNFYSYRCAKIAGELEQHALNKDIDNVVSTHDLLEKMLLHLAGELKIIRNDMEYGNQHSSLSR